MPLYKHAFDSLTSRKTRSESEDSSFGECTRRLPDNLWVLDSIKAACLGLDHHSSSQLLFNMSSFKNVASFVFVFALLAVSFQPSEAQFYYTPRLWSSYRALYAPSYYHTPYYVPSYAYVIGSNKGGEGAPEGPQAPAFKSSGLTNNQ
uniref:Uncharacterized protein n=1 Tax=Steinernema glaseri TaxID=37863 RepID=A0A1I7ZD18_9BILA